MTDATKYQVGDPVWSKMKGYCPWPSRIASPSESTLKNNDKLKGQKTFYLVFFFGSRNYAWMAEDSIKPYDEFKDKNKNGSKTGQFKMGLKQIEEYIANGGKATLADSVTCPAIKNNNNDNEADSPSAGGDSFSNDGDLPSIDEELAVIRKAEAAPDKKFKNSHAVPQNDSSSLTSPVPPSVQRDYSRTPFKNARKTAKPAAAVASEEPATDIITSPTKRAKTYDDQLGSTTLSSSTFSPTATVAAAVAPAPKPATKSGARNLIFRATSQYNDSSMTDAPRVNFDSATTKSKTIRPSSLKFGFIGLGLMGQRIVKNLLNSGHKVTIYNRSTHKCKDFIEAGAAQAETPADVVAATDIVFGCVKDATATKDMIFGTFGLLSEMGPSKGYVELTSVDPETSKDIFEAIVSKGGQYLEAPTILSGKKSAEEGELIISAAGDRKLYDECHSCFQAMAKKTFYLGSDVGIASRMNLIFASLYGTMVGGIAECLTLLERSTLSVADFTDILKLSPMFCPVFNTFLNKITKNQHAVAEIPLGHVQKDLRMALNLADDLDQTVPILASVNEKFKVAKRYGYCDDDASSVHVQSKY